MKSLHDRAADLQSRLDSSLAGSESSRRHSSTDLQSEQWTQEKKKLEARLHEYQTQISRLQLDTEQMVARYQALLTQAATAQDTKQSDPALISQIQDLKVSVLQLRDENSKISSEKSKFSRIF